MTFSCGKCGLCCRHVDRSFLTAHLDRGDGTCLHLESDGATCHIYYDRPTVCRVDEYYPAIAEKISLHDYYKINVDACRALQKEHDNLTQTNTQSQ
jgi:uncharacterized protein